MEGEKLSLCPGLIDNGSKLITTDNFSHFKWQTLYFYLIVFVVPFEFVTFADLSDVDMSSWNGTFIA